MFLGDDLLISEVRHQSIRLQEILRHLETDHDLKTNAGYYCNALQMIERALRKIRSRAFEHVDIC